jgi:ubiquinone/menaquinone biosynthesis C-methylase UbiE
LWYTLDQNLDLIKESSMKPFLLSLLIGALFSASTAFAQETAQEVAPATQVPEGINESFLDPNLEAEEMLNRFEVESREVYHNRDKIVAAMKLEKGDRVADIGAGTGIFSKLFSETVGGEGKVYALDISPRLVDYMKKRFETEGRSNVLAVLSKPETADLPADSVDAVFTCDTYHHFELYREMLASIHKALAPGGQFVIVDFERIPGVSRDWILGHVRAGKEQVISEVEAAGFKFLEEVDLPELDENYMLRFQKPKVE